MCSLELGKIFLYPEPAKYIIALQQEPQLILLFNQLHVYVTLADTEEDQGVQLSLLMNLCFISNYC